MAKPKGNRKKKTELVFDPKNRRYVNHEKNSISFNSCVFRCKTNLQINAICLHFHRDFLTGFRKRKQERKQKAREDLEKQVKEERKRIKQEVIDSDIFSTILPHSIAWLLFKSIFR